MPHFDWSSAAGSIWLTSARRTARRIRSPSQKIIRPGDRVPAAGLPLRRFGKRILAQLNPFDFVVLLTLSNTVQNAIIGNDTSLLAAPSARRRCSRSTRCWSGSTTGARCLSTSPRRTWMS